MEDHMLKYFKNQTQASKGHKPQETISLSYIDRISSSMEGKKDQTRRLRIHFKRKRNPLHLKAPSMVDRDNWMINLDRCLKAHKSSNKAHHPSIDQTDLYCEAKMKEAKNKFLQSELKKKQNLNAQMERMMTPLVSEMNVSGISPANAEPEPTVEKKRVSTDNVKVEQTSGNGSVDRKSSDGPLAAAAGPPPDQRRKSLTTLMKSSKSSIVRAESGSASGGQRANASDTISDAMLDAGNPARPRGRSSPSISELRPPPKVSGNISGCHSPASRSRVPRVPRKASAKDSHYINAISPYASYSPRMSQNRNKAHGQYMFGLTAHETVELSVPEEGGAESFPSISAPMGRYRGKSISKNTAPSPHPSMLDTTPQMYPDLDLHSSKPSIPNLPDLAATTPTSSMPNINGIHPAITTTSPRSQCKPRTRAIRENDPEVLDRTTQRPEAKIISNHNDNHPRAHLAHAHSNAAGQPQPRHTKDDSLIVGQGHDTTAKHAYKDTNTTYNTNSLVGSLVVEGTRDRIISGTESWGGLFHDGNGGACSPAAPGMYSYNTLKMGKSRKALQNDSNSPLQSNPPNEVMEANWSPRSKTSGASSRPKRSRGRTWSLNIAPPSVALVKAN
uniref:PH domain-containing protein n=1 Tax=Amorphochlora amoebiformis TaxID=1561963 RepID=A0A7S0CSH0_9EUKA